MVLYLCNRCGYSTSYKSHFTYHINRKNICEAIITDISILDISKNYGIKLKSHHIAHNTTHKNHISQDDNDNEFSQTPPKSSKSAPKNSEIAPKNSEFAKCAPKNSEFAKNNNTNSISYTITENIINKNILKSYNCEYCDRQFTIEKGK